MTPPRNDPPELLTAYQQAATEDDRERAAMALYAHHAAVRVPPATYDVYYEANMAAINWHVTAGHHRASAIAERFPSPYDRPLECPRGAALRHLWAYRHWNIENVCDGSGGSGGAYGAYWARQSGDTIDITTFNNQPCTERFKVRALWREMFGDGRVRQMSMF